ncbi:Cysteine/Histidine-rich C1 domain family protein [Perilla frutescens var. hirtella]|uniref:Cysteine/Histidine-rich C1 domain family protein n=1 Tax=Perilla frutescens var. hirtella TaxID=608512 RepID=A0AAD4ITP4_PERFH|nr:Cysteine/Histidine-rich C1 domain family protein [Perilla frutescens var. hirtella]
MQPSAAAGVGFPSSPQSASGEGITHYAHSKHPLVEVTLSELFTCGGCKEYGAGRRFACQDCDFQLHDFCATSPPVLNNHPFHGHHQLVFHAKPKSAKGGISWPRCDVCGKSSKGFAFRCRACNFQMHPCCAMLTTEAHFPAHPHALRLLPAVSTTTNGGVACGQCSKRRSGRMYRCTVCEYHLHAVCAKDFINGLQANGIPPPERPSALGTAARLASQVVIEFIGGLIEGLGEGMGEALVQNIVRGRCVSRRRIQPP